MVVNYKEKNIFEWIGNPVNEMIREPFSLEQNNISVPVTDYFVKLKTFLSTIF